jgi:hypothetical protein
MPKVPFRAFAADCLIEARVDPPRGVRLTDFLNTSGEVSLENASLIALDDGRIVDAGDVIMPTMELCAVEGTDAGGAPGHRIRTRSKEVEMVVGPYRIAGYLHGPTAADPLASLSRRNAMVPVTAAKIAFLLSGEVRVRESGTLIVNRLLAEIGVPERDAPSILDRLGLSPVDVNAKDLTGELSVGPPERDERQRT